MKELTLKGLGTVKKQAQPLTPEQEDYTYGNREYLVQVMPRVCSTQSFGMTANALVCVVVMNTGT